MAKIAFVGTFSTGKTTLVHEIVFNLRKNGVDAEALEEIARKCPFPINEKAIQETQLWNITYQISEELAREKKCEILVCDRSVLDSYAYHVHFFKRKQNWEPMLKEYMQTYKLLVRVPIRNGLLKPDGIRSVDPEFQKQMDFLIEKLLKKFKLNYSD